MSLLVAAFQAFPYFFVLMALLFIIGLAVHIHEVTAFHRFKKNLNRTNHE